MCMFQNSKKWPKLFSSFACDISDTGPSYMESCPLTYCSLFLLPCFSHLVSPTSFFPPRFSYLVSPTSFLLPRFSYLVSPTSFLLPRFSYLVSPTSFPLPRFTYLVSPTSFLKRLLGTRKWKVVSERPEQKSAVLTVSDPFFDPITPIKG